MDLVLRLLAVLTLVALSRAAARRAGEGWAAYCGLTGPVGRTTGAGAVLGLAFAAVGLAAEGGLGLRLFHLAAPVQAAALAAALAYAALWWPLLEEWLFRGLLQRLLSDRWGGAVGNLLQALLFALLHRKSALGWPHLLAAAVFGLLAGWLRLHTRSLWPGLTAHVAANAAVLLWYFAFPA